MGSVYIVGKDITDKSVYLFSNVNVSDIENLSKVVWRYGIFRADSIIGGAFILGLFNLLILTIYLYIKKRPKIWTIALLASGIIASVLRTAYGGLLFLMTVIFIKKRSLLVLLLLIMIIFAIAQVNFNYDFSLSSIINSYVSDNLDPDDNIRRYSRYKAIEIWKDHPLWGVGPGMFGGRVASKYPSYVYDEYNVLLKAYMKHVSGIEHFWLQILAETGIVGTLCFSSLFAVLFIVLSNLRARSVTEEMKGLFSGLRVFIGCILIYSLGIGLNIAPVLFTYCAFLGIEQRISSVRHSTFILS
jgi:O-antigen ligase